MEKNEKGYVDKALVRVKHLRGKIHMLAQAMKLTDEEYRYIIGSYGAKSSLEMNEEQLQDAIMKLDFEKKKREKREWDEMDHLRKMVMASIGAWLAWKGTTTNTVMIKAIACRAAKMKPEEFNRISKPKLMRIYNRFKAMREAALDQPKYEAAIRTEQLYMEFNEETHKWQINTEVKKMLDKQKKTWE